MKRISALILTALLLIGMTIPTVLAENSPPAPVQAASSRQPDTPPEETAEAENVPDTSQTETGGTMTAASLLSAQTETAENTATALHFADLRSVLTKYNPSIRSMQASMGDLSSTGRSALEGAQDGLEKLLAGVNASLKDVKDGVLVNSPTQGAEPSDLYIIYSGLAASLQTCSTLLGAQVSTLDSQIGSITTTTETAKNTLNNGINQVIKGAETLYVGIVTMEASQKGVERSLAALDRAVAIREKQVELGTASEYDAETLRYQRAQAASGLESLKFQIRTSKLTLEGMCGMELNGVVALDALTPPTEEELSAVSYEANVKKAAAHNVDVMNADVKRDNGKDTDYRSLKKAYDAAVDSFNCSYKILCLTVPEKARLAQTARQTVDYQQRTFEIAEKKYALGMLSHEDYQSAADSLESARDALDTAQRELFSAYRSYFWATNYGIA